MKKNSIKAILLSLLILSSTTSEVFAETNKISSCEFSNYDGDAGRQKVIDLIASTFLEEAFKTENPRFIKLDEIINKLKSQDCKLADGRPALNFIKFGFESAFDSINNWDLTLTKIKALRKNYPNAAYPILAEAQYWVQYAWAARGNGFASSVTPDGWRLFHERLTKAKELLIKNKEIGSTLPIWYELILSTESGLDRPQEEQNKYFVEGFERYKTFLPLYIVKRNILEPKWGGSWKSVDDFINWSASNTKETEGLSMYSRLYFGVFDNRLEGSNFFNDTLVDWTKFRQGFDDLIRLNPKSQFHLNVFASMACEANDKLTFLKIRKRITNPIEWSWKINYPPSLCDTKFGYKK